MAKAVEVRADDEAAILDFLPDAAEMLRGADVTESKPKADDEEAGPEAEESEEISEGEEAGENAEESEEEISEDEKPNGVQRRIDKLVAKAKTAEERAQELEAKVKELEGKTVEPVIVRTPTAADPLADIADDKQLAEKVQHAIAVKRWCIENPDGGTVKNALGEDVEIEPAAGRRMLADAEEILTIHAPRKERFLKDKAGHEKEAREIYPDMFKEGTESAKAYQSLIQAWPEVTRFPDFQIVIGDYMAGVNARRAKKSEKPAVEPAKRGIAPPVPKTIAAKPKTRIPAADRVVSSGGSLDSITEYFAG